MRSELDRGLAEADAADVHRVLRQARDSLRFGYAEDWCHREGAPLPHFVKLSELKPHELGYSMMGGVLRAHRLGPICPPDDEGVRFFDAKGALEASARGDVDALLVCEDLLRWLTPGNASLGGRVGLPELLKLFDRAVLRAQAVARRKD